MNLNQNSPLSALQTSPLIEGGIIKKTLKLAKLSNQRHFNNNLIKPNHQKTSNIKQKHHNLHKHKKEAI
jgi:hypothetical protein